MPLDKQKLKLAFVTYLAMTKVEQNLVMVRKKETPIARMVINFLHGDSRKQLISQSDITTRLNDIINENWPKQTALLRLKQSHIN
jgi:hypothetical protein